MPIGQEVLAGGPGGGACSQGWPPRPHLICVELYISSFPFVFCSQSRNGNTPHFYRNAVCTVPADLVYSFRRISRVVKFYGAGYSVIVYIFTFNH